MRHCCLGLLCCFSLLSASVRPAVAQETTATIVGTVVDQSGAVLPGVTITIKQVSTGRLFETISGPEGRYFVPLLPVGQYEVTFALAGFQPHVVRGLSVAVNDRVSVDATLSPGGVSEVVEVTGRSLTQTTTAVQELIDSQRVQELPINNRNFAKLAELAPGVSSDLADEATFGSPAP